MKLLNFTTKLLGLKDQNIHIQFILNHPDYTEIIAKLDYKPAPCPHCNDKMIKYDFQKPSTIPLLDTQGMPMFSSSRSAVFSANSAAEW